MTRLSLLLLSLLIHCRPGTSGPAPDADAGVSLVNLPSATTPGAPRSGMVWIPAGMLKAGTAANVVPRIAEEELEGVEIPLGGFYIDLLPFPNELGAIPTTNVTRDEAQQRCVSKSKRLCSELEWERACKGPNQYVYEYGDTYREPVCGTGILLERSARRPVGDRDGCRSAFGVRELHGGVLEWTSSPWGRGTKGDLGTTRGGNGTRGEIVARCANGLPKPVQGRSPSLGFRCCAGPVNDASVDLTVKTGLPLATLNPSELAESMATVGCDGDAGERCRQVRTWVWHPAGNVEVYVRGTCRETDGRDQANCQVLVFRVAPNGIETVATIDTGRHFPEVSLTRVDVRTRIRMRAGPLHRAIFREVTYSYGRFDVRDMK
ncbi:MAG: SUMF1/EgtB/PvdO family nonheme iron enzyme [Myxococcales bacterium]